MQEKCVDYQNGRLQNSEIDEYLLWQFVFSTTTNQTLSRGPKTHNNKNSATLLEYKAYPINTFSCSASKSSAGTSLANVFGICVLMALCSG